MGFPFSATFHTTGLLPAHSSATDTALATTTNPGACAAGRRSLQWYRHWIRLSLCEASRFSFAGLMDCGLRLVNRLRMSVLANRLECGDDIIIGEIGGPMPIDLLGLQRDVIQ
jgi:hypothetical protein